VLEGGLLPFGMLVLLLSPLIAGKIRGTTAMTWMEWYNSLETELDACAGDHRADLADPLPDHHRDFRLRVRAGVSPKGAVEVALPFAINLVANLIFTPIQFGLRNLPLASVDILVVWATIIWMMVAIWKHYRWVAVAQVPYFVWVSIATVLQLSITGMNWGK
jgi:translocator protein